MNNQRIEKQIIRSDGMLDIVNVFWTIQGEGIFAGCPAVFVRLAGCNLQCPSCDTDYTSKRRLYTHQELLNLISGALPHAAVWSPVRKPRAERLVVFTGGEPFRQTIGELVGNLVYNGWDVQMETNGTFFQDNFPYQRVNVTCSPKTPTLHPQIIEHISFLKYILNHKLVSPDDGLPLGSLGYGGKPARIPDFPPNKIFLQPEYPSDVLSPGCMYEDNVQAAVQSCLKYGYRMSLQLHKQLGVE